MTIAYPAMNRIKNNVPAFLDCIHNLDVVMFQWMMKRKHLELWVRLCRLFSRTADGFTYPVIGLTLYAWGGKEGQLFTLTMAAAFLLERPLYLILKKGLKRNRPAQAIANFDSFIIPSDKFSFPSGHTSGAFAMATGLSLYLPELGALAFGWATLVGVSRVTLGVHFPTDTLAGATMGSAITLISALWITL